MGFAQQTTLRVIILQHRLLFQIILMERLAPVGVAVSGSDCYT